MPRARPVSYCIPDLASSKYSSTIGDVDSGVEKKAVNSQSNYTQVLQSGRPINEALCLGKPSASDSSCPGEPMTAELRAHDDMQSVTELHAHCFVKLMIISDEVLD